MDTSVSDSPKRKPRKALTLAERIKVIERKEKGESTKSIAAAFGTGLTQIVNICANKQELKEKEREKDFIIILKCFKPQLVFLSENFIEV